MATILNLSTYKRKERMKSGELLAQALTSKQNYYEQEIESVTRTEQWAIGVKNTVMEERCRVLRGHLAETLLLLDDGIMRPRHAGASRGRGGEALTGRVSGALRGAPVADRQ